VVGLSPVASPAIWHDVECASYDADLPLWRSLADAAGRGAAILDLGCGTGRVALDLAERGHDVTGLDCEPSFTAALAARARGRDLLVRAETADARSFSLGGRRFALAIAPMQVAQLLGGSPGRAAMLACVRRHLLEPGGVFAIALADPFEAIPDDEEPLPPLPDVREEDGWVYSSTPVNVREGDGFTAIERLRQAVSPDGELDESMATITLDAVRPDELEAQAVAADAGRAWRVLERRSVPATPDYVGSAVVMLEAVAP
jgi:SAM-dependent methyltransferase